ncbi:MAG: hypothetical protein LT070_02885 [Solirubrobacteraceae bacterium]|nr:hypothetical protein [Solirubrobacteraceae bacterium]
MFTSTTAAGARLAPTVAVVLVTFASSLAPTPPPAAAYGYSSFFKAYSTCYDEAVGKTYWDQGSSSTNASVYSWFYHWLNGQWALSAYREDYNSGVGPKEARVSYVMAQSTPRLISSTHRATFFSGYRYTSAQKNDVCA